MKLIVVSPEAHDPREIPVVHALFAAGLERYHLRKPGWSASELETWLRAFSPEERARIVGHSHSALVERCGLAGAHESDRGQGADRRFTTFSGLRSRACHDLATLRQALGHDDAVLLSPIFPSISKPGYGPSREWDLKEIKRLLENRTLEQRRTEVFALGGVDETTAEACFRYGFDGVAVLGAIWSADDPTQAFQRLVEQCAQLGAPVGRAAPGSSPWHFPARRSRLPRHPIMCLTQDGLPLSHLEQTTRLCAAGAGWIQLRMKEAKPAVWLATAQSIAAVCRKHGAVFIVNDNVDIALQAGADGVHLGKLDLDWAEARERLGPDRILGGTINHSFDAARARAVGCLDYVGVGPWRFTANKKNLAPVLGAAGVRRLIAELDGLPAWVIGGVDVSDLPAVQETGAAGVAVSSALYRQGNVENDFAAFSAAWPSHTKTTAADQLASALCAAGSSHRPDSKVTIL